MLAVVGDDDGRTGSAGDVSDVGVVDPAADDGVARRRLRSSGRLIGSRQIVNRHPPEHFLLQQHDRVISR